MTALLTTSDNELNAEIMHVLQRGKKSNSKQQNNIKC